MFCYLLLVVVLILAGPTAAARPSYENTKSILDGASISWTLEPDSNNIAMSFTANAGGWVSVGFSSDGQMAGAFAVIGWATNSGGTSVKEYDLNSKSLSGIVEASESVLTETSVEQTGGSTTMAFERPITRGSRSISVDGDTYIIWAFHDSEDQLSYHSQRGVIQVNFSTGSSKTQTSSAAQIHGILMLIAFDVFMPIAMYVARFMNRDTKRWFQIHRGFQVFAFLLIVAGFVVIIVHKENLSSAHFSGAHEIIGLIVILLVFIQMVFGALRPHPEAGKIRKSWFFGHSWNGRIIYILAVLNIIFGHSLYSEQNPGSSVTAVRVVHFVLVGMFVIASIATTIKRRREASTSEEESLQK